MTPDLLSEELKTKIYAKLLDFCSYKPRSVVETKRKLQTLFDKYCKDISKEAAVVVSDYFVNKLKEQEILNEDVAIEQYVQSFVTSSKPKGLLSIKRQLLSKGFDKNKIDSTLSKVDHETEEQKALELASKYLKKANFAGYTKKHKLTNYLLGKGFNYSLISKISANFKF